jgi:ketosteroid isomerase-like protein
MAPVDRRAIARGLYDAFAAGDRAFFEKRLREDFTFSSPPDPHLDRDGWFERCWPAAGTGQAFTYRRLIEAGDEVVVTYELRRPDGGGTNTEVITVDDDGRIARVEVFFGWDLRDDH